MPKDLALLDPAFRTKLIDLLAACVCRGVEMVPYETLRDPWTQARYWRQSRSLTEINAKIADLRGKGAPFLADIIESVGPQSGKPVTNAIPGLSWHQWGEAADCYWKVNGGAEWSSSKLIVGINGYQVFAQEALNLKLDAGGLWSTLKDWPHVQMRSGKSPLSHHSLPQIDNIMRERFGEPASQLVASAGLVAAADMKLAFHSSYGWKVYGTANTPAYLWRARMTICADGAPKCYHPQGAPPGLDYTANGGHSGNWWGIATHDGRPDGNPLIQTAGDPAPGFYVSMTALGDPMISYGKQERYVDSNTIPYIVLPGGKQVSQFSGPVPLKLGDLAAVYHVGNKSLAFAICAEVGPKEQLGEGSIELARRLGIPEAPKNGGIQSKDIVYLAFPGSGNQRPQPDSAIQPTAGALFDAWGGMERLNQCIGGIGI